MTRQEQNFMAESAAAWGVMRVVTVICIPEHDGSVVAILYRNKRSTAFEIRDLLADGELLSWLDYTLKGMEAKTAPKFTLQTSEMGRG